MRFIVEYSAGDIIIQEAGGFTSGVVVQALPGMRASAQHWCGLRHGSVKIPL